MSSHIIMGYCPGCGDAIKAHDKFDIVVLRINGKNHTRYYHPDCNPDGHHHKD